MPCSALPCPLVFFLVAILLLSGGPATPSARAQTPSLPSSSKENLDVLSPAKDAAIKALVGSIRSLRQDIEETEAKLATEPPGPAADDLKAELKAAENALDDKRFDLLSVATEVDLSSFESVEVESFSLQSSLEDLIRPLIEEIKRATEDTRESQRLQNQFTSAKEQSAIVGKALESLDNTIAATKDDAIRAELSLLRQQWSERFDDLRNEISVLGFQIEEIKSQKRSFISETSNLATRFFRTRGRNLLIALAVAFGVLIALRFLRTYLHEKTDFLRKDRSTTARLIDVALYFASFLGALIGGILVLIIAGDWVLIGLVALLLIGLILSTKDTLPGYADEIRLILNIGSVREGERIVYNGVPWLVEKLSFYSTLKNPVLRGGTLHMPVGQLVSMLSRPTADREPYFPCEEGDWLRLEDETFGRVIFQSAEMVRIIMLGGAQKTYPTEAFLGQNPTNLSHNFRISTMIGIDYDHQPDSTGEILEKLKAYFQAEIHKVVDHKFIHSINVDFAMANTSSLDYTVLLDVAGEMAPKFQSLSRTLQRIGVDACNEFGLVIPFQQVTIHTNDAASE